jgi:hypothetical protein
MYPSLIGIIASSGVSVGAGGDYESIATVTVGSGGSSTVTFNSIPSTYQHLQIRVHGMLTATSAAISFRVGTGGTPDTTTSNYYYHRLTGNGAAASAGAGADIPQSAWVTGNSSTANPEVFVTDILDYKDTNKQKTIRMLSGVDNNGSGEINLTSAVWKNTGAIDVIQMIPNTGNFAEYASFALYGIKG